MAGPFLAKNSKTAGIFVLLLCSSIADFPTLINSLIFSRATLCFSNAMFVANSLSVIFPVAITVVMASSESTC